MPRSKGRNGKLIAFNRGQVPTIVCMDKTTVDLGVNFNKLIRALQKYVDRHFAPAWGTPARLVKGTRLRSGAWTLGFFDAAKDATPFLDKKKMGKAFGRHRLGTNGLPLAVICVLPTRENGEEVSLVASHELAEMLVDPFINLWAAGPRKTFHAYETCDVCEQESFEIDGIAMSDFVYPAWFEEFRKPGSTKFDHLNKIHRPFQILKGGYSQVRKGRKSMKMFGSETKKRRFEKENRDLHRSEYRDTKA